MADVDDELLALVGGDESSDDEAEQNIGTSRSLSGSLGPNTSSNSKQKTKRKDDDSDQEEGEASSIASPASQNSAPMDESDSESDAFQTTNTNGKMDDDDDNKYPVEGIYASEAEKDEILAMPELEREQLLARRQEEVDRQRQNTLLRRLLKTREDDSQSAKKRKASSADLDETQRKTSRQRTRVGGSKVGETSVGIESLRRARAEKNDRLRRREEDRERNKKTHSASRGSDRDDGDSDIDWAGRSRDRRTRSRTPEVKEIPPSDLHDIERLRIGRSRFARVCFYPGFNAALTGCYARIALGPDSEGVDVYRVALIKGFTQGKPYAMEKENGHHFVTDQYVKAAHGKAERDWPFISCSDKKITEAEFKRYKAVCQDEGVIIPKKPILEAKIDDINNLMHRSWTEAEVNAKIERERTLREKFAPTERNRLLDMIEEARRRGNDARVSELQNRLDSIETPRLAFRTSLAPAPKPTSLVPSQQDRLAALNAENRRRNAEKVRKAQIMEKAKSRMQARQPRRGENGESTPASGGSPSPGNGASKQSDAAKAPLLPHLQKLQAQNHLAGKDKKGVPQIHKPIGDDDIIAALDLEIDVEID